MTTEPEPTPPMSVGQAIATVMGRLPAIGKTEGAKGVPYKFRGIEAMTVALQPILADVGLVIVPQAQSVVIDPSPGQKEAWQDVMVKFEWLIIGPDGSTVTASTYGIGRDHTDKGTNKAQTQAYKYLVMHLFCVSDPKDDGDAHDYTDAVYVEPPPPDPKVAETYSKLVSVAGDDDVASALKEWAHGMDRALSERALAEDEGWRLAVEAKLREYTAPVVDTNEGSE